ncbi:MAG: hypothetical protein K2G07_03820 [Muribaculaceae bacterium]|nr:hypothetical protein [Muribaculaceae bacterium]
MRSLLHIVILLVLAGCGVSATRPAALDEARRLMTEDPGAALERLNALDLAELDDSATMAEWALLYSEALVANRLTAPNDTIVGIAIEYYGRHGRKQELRKASELKALISGGDHRDELATALYLQKEKEFFLYKERSARELLMLAVLLVLVAAGAAMVWMRQRLRLKQAQNEALMAEASGLESKLRELLAGRFELIDSLCQTYYESQGTKAERKAVVEMVKREIEAVRTDSFPRMEQAVNDCRGNLLDKVKECWPDIKPDDYRLLVYLAGSLSSRTISLLLGESVEVVYKRKSRLKARLKERVAPAFPAVMEVF